MKVLHCCLAAFYIDDFSYQENILPRIHRGQGHEVEIIASTETYLDRVRLGYTNPGSYVSQDGLRVTRLPYVDWLPSRLARKLRIYKGLKVELQRVQPDIIFLHDCQFLSISAIVRYAKRHGTVVYVDCHTDFINSGRTWLSRAILHRLVYRVCAKHVEPVTRRFYATLPLRADLLRNVYGIADHLITLLPFGVDDSRINPAARATIRAALRENHGLRSEQLVFVAGGKIDRRKAIHTLIDAFAEASDSGRLGDAVLIVFGTPEPALEAALAQAGAHPAIRCVGWVASAEIHKYLWAADVALFPGTHSVLWEEAVGLGMPCVFRRWAGIEHVDLGGNCIMLDTVTQATLTRTLEELACQPEKLTAMRQVAESLGPEVFSYTQIAKRALADVTGRAVLG